MQKYNYRHDIEITNPSTVSTFVLKYTFLFSLWFMLFIAAPIYAILTYHIEWSQYIGIQPPNYLLQLKLQKPSYGVHSSHFFTNFVETLGVYQ
jgi:hypothetical protein